MRSFAGLVEIVKQIVIILSLFVSLNSYAQLWEPVVQFESLTTYSYDPLSVKREGDIVNYWELVDYEKPLNSGVLLVASSKTMVIQDCINNKFRVATLMDFDGHKGMGKIINVELFRTAKWYESTTGSVNEVLKKLVCKD